MPKGNTPKKAKMPKKKSKFIPVDSLMTDEGMSQVLEVPESENSETNPQHPGITVSAA